MASFEYKVIPAPRKGLKAKGVKTSDGRLALAIEDIMNEMGAQGWQYLRADTLPVEERSGLTGKSTTFQHLLVFTRELAEAAEPAEAEPVALIEDHAEPVEPDLSVEEEAPEQEAIDTEEQPVEDERPASTPQ